MPRSPKHKDLRKLVDSVEAKLTPEELAIKYVDEVRRYPTLPDFLKAQAKLTFRESELAKACKALSQQAQDRYPGSTPQEIAARNKLRQTLSMEFHGLTTLISNVSRTIEFKCEMFGMSGLLIGSQMLHLEHLIWQDPFLITASDAAKWIKRNKSSNGDRKHKRAILQGLAVYTKVMRQLPTLLAKSWIQRIVILLMRVYAYQMAVQDVQGKFFEDHSILSHETEDTLKNTIEHLLETMDTYKEFMQVMNDGTGLPDEPDSESELTDVEAIQKGAREMADKIASDWITDAHDRGVAGISPWTSEQEDLVWKNFQKKYGSNN
jgi:hypothetical protein